MPSETIRIIYRREATGWWAESPDVEGWSAAANDFPSLRQLAVEGIQFVLCREIDLEHFVPEAMRQGPRCSSATERRMLC